MTQPGTFPRFCCFAIKKTLYAKSRFEAIAKAGNNVSGQLFQAQHILHIKQPDLPDSQKLRRTHRALGVILA